MSPALLGVFLAMTASAADPAPTETTAVVTAPTTPTADVPWRKNPIDPKYESDFTAYTVPKKHLRMGPFNVDYGLLKNTSVGTTPLIYFLAVPNIHGKVTAIQTPKFDASFAINWYGYDASVITHVKNAYVSAYPITATGSWMLGKHFTLHFGERWENFSAKGAVDIKTLSTVVANVAGMNINSQLQGMLPEGALYGGAALSLSQFQLGMDYRINRRDSIIVLTRSYTRLQGRLDAGYSNDGIATGAAVRIDKPLTDVIGSTTTISYQLSYEHLHVRVGIPLSTAYTLAGAMQAYELYWLF